MKHMMIPLAVLASGALASTADAAVTVRAVAVANASFEQAQYADGQFDISRPAGWFTSGSNATTGVQNPTSEMVANVPEGQNIAFLSAYRFKGENRDGTLFQTLAEAIAAGTLYSMSVDVVRRTDVAEFGPWVAEFLAGDDVVALGSLATNDVAPGGFSTLKIDYTGTDDMAGRALGIRFRSFYSSSQGDDFHQVDIDNVRVTASAEAIPAVPEPATWAMMICGFAMVGAAARRRRSLSRVVTA